MLAPNLHTSVILHPSDYCYQQWPEFSCMIWSVEALSPVPSAQWELTGSTTGWCNPPCLLIIPSSFLEDLILMEIGCSKHGCWKDIPPSINGPNMFTPEHMTTFPIYSGFIGLVFGLAWFLAGDR